jgi:hypothetical protein
MSFITLKSTLHNNYVSSSESAATWTNNFEVPIELGPGNTLQLVSCSVRKSILYTVTGSNNTFYWRIGVGAFDTGTPAQLLSTPYEALQHKITIANGVYTGNELAVEIAYQLNNSTIIGMFKGGWTCVYTDVGGADKGSKFVIAWTQIGAPPESEDLNGQIMTNVYDLTGLIPIVNGVTQTKGALALPTPPFSPNNGFKFTNPTNVNTGAMIRQLNTTLTFENLGSPVPTSARSDEAYNELSLSYLGDKSIFANGGIITNIIRPVCFIDDYQWVRAGPLADVCFTNWNNNLGVQVTAQASDTPAGPELTLGWTTTLTLPGGTVPAGPLYMFTDSGGCVGISDDPTKSAVEDNCTFGFFKPESTDVPAYSISATLVELTATESSAPGASIGVPQMTIAADFAVFPAVATPFVINYGTTYANSQTGFVRSALQNPDNFKDSNQNYSAAPGDADVQLNMITNPDNTSILIDLWYMDDQTGITFPSPGWRQAAAAITGLDLAGALAAASPGFVFGQSSYRVDIKVDKIKNLMVTIAHNAAGGDAVGWGAETVIAVSGLLVGNLPLRPIEAHYPLRPFISSATGLPFDPAITPLPYDPDNNGLAQQYVGGIFDTSVTTQEGLDLQNIKLNPTSSSLIPPAVGAPGPVELPFLLKAGNIDATDIYYPPDPGSDTTISTNDVFENQANIESLIAFEPIYNKRTPAVSHGAESNTELAPELTGNRGTIQVEIPEFNIESWSGRSSDKGRAVGVIPTAEWTTGDITGSLHYQSQYARPIDLNLPFIKPFYSLQCRLRNLDGTVVQGLDNSTEVVLMVGTTEESKQARVMNKAMDRLANLVANRQEAKISQPFDGSMGI